MEFARRCSELSFGNGQSNLMLADGDWSGRLLIAARNELSENLVILESDRTQGGQYL
jgi:hypothetical protein